MFGECISQFSCALCEHTTVANLKLESNLIAGLKRDIKMTRVEDLPQFNLNCAKNLVLVES